MELERRGLRTLTLVSEPFEQLANVQAKAMGFNPALVIVPHPVGGVAHDEVIARHVPVVWPSVQTWMGKTLA